MDRQFVPGLIACEYVLTTRYTASTQYGWDRQGRRSRGVPVMWRGAWVSSFFS